MTEILVYSPVGLVKNNLFTLPFVALSSDILVQNGSESLLDSTAKTFKVGDIIILANGAVFPVIPKSIVAPVNGDNFNMDKFPAYIRKLIELVHSFQNVKKSVGTIDIKDEKDTTGKKIKYSLSESFINFYRFMGFKEYVTVMFISDRYTAEDIMSYKIDWTEDITLELEDFLTYFYVHFPKGSVNIERIRTKYEAIPLYLLQLLYRQYVDPDYQLIKDQSAYEEYITILV